MYTNDETKLAGKKPYSNSFDNQKNEEEGKNSNNDMWKKVAIGGAIGILMGGGAAFAANKLTSNSDETAEDSNPEELPKEAHVSDNQSFSDAFNEARAQVGPGGVFSWHGRLYNTYTEEEWNSMSDAEKQEFAQAVAPEVNAADAYAQTPTMDDSIDGGATTASIHGSDDMAHAEHASAVKDEDVTVAQPANQDDSDVHVVGVSQIQGHTAVALDLNGNGEADVAVIDVNDNKQIDVDDIVVDKEGHAATMGDLAQATGNNSDDGMQATSAESEDYSSDPNIQASYSGDDGSSTAMGGDDITGGYDPGDDSFAAM